MKRKRIGVILSEVESYYQTRVLNGIMAKAFQLNYDVLIFSSFVKQSFIAKYEDGEKNIYNIINYDKLDAVIVLGDTIKIPGALEQICSDIETKFNGPVVFLDYKYKDYTTVYTQDELPFMHLTEHLITEHGCKKIMFLSGDLEQASTRERLKGYKRALTKHGIEIDDDLICFDGGFWYDKAAEVANHIIYGRRKKPDAIVCCGDYMAIGVIHEYQKNGFKVPDDMIVVGYDAIDEAIGCVPAVTSYFPPLFEAGENSVMTVDAMINGKGKPELIIGGGKIEIGGSCGCQEDYTYTKRDYLDTTVKIKYHDFLNSNMMENLACATDPDDLMGYVQYFLYLLVDWKRFYLCLNENWLDADNVFGDEDSEHNGYTDNMILRARGIDGVTRTLHEVFYRGELFPGLDEDRGEPMAFFFTPMHFIKRCLGYAVLSYGSEPKCFDITYRNWTKHINNALESMRIQNSIALLAVRDALTGVYSRIGVERNIRPLQEKMENKKNKFFLLIGDVDRLKHINDVYGHNCGDIAIKAVADALTASIKNNELCARIGGDEFVVLGCGDYWDDYPERFCQRVKDHLAVYNKYSDNAFDVSVSLGGICRRIDDIKELKSVFEIADQAMYMSKRAKHAERK